MQINEGIIYSSSEIKPIVFVGKKVTKLKRSVSILNWMGITLIILAIGAVTSFFWPIFLEETKYAFGQTKVGRTMERISNKEMKIKIITEPEINEQPNWIVPDKNYSIYIPKILAKARVIGEVNAGIISEYSTALKIGVAEAAGLSHPGETGTTYLFAHSAGNNFEVVRYNAIFYLLDKLASGDGIEVVYKDKLYRYIVDKKEIIAASDVKYFKPQTDEERLVLQTCYPPGTTWKRLIVVAKPV